MDDSQLCMSEMQLLILDMSEMGCVCVGECVGMCICVYVWEWVWVSLGMYKYVYVCECVCEWVCAC